MSVDVQLADDEIGLVVGIERTVFQHIAAFHEVDVHFLVRGDIVLLADHVADFNTHIFGRIAIFPVCGYLFLSPCIHVADVADLLFLRVLGGDGHAAHQQTSISP